MAAALGELTLLLSQAAIMAVDPATFDELFRRLGKIEGAAINLRGALFGYLVADLVRQTDTCIDIRINQVFADPQNATARAEVDVLATTHPRDVRFIECKGYRPGGTVPDDMVRTRLEVRVPLLRRVALAHPDWKSRKLCFEFWTTGDLSPAARELIRDGQKAISPNKYSIVVREAEHVDALAKQSQDTALRRTLAEHFLERPFETIERDLARMSARQRRKALTGAPPADAADLADLLDSVDDMRRPALPAPGPLLSVARARRGVR